MTAVKAKRFLDDTLKDIRQYMQELSRSISGTRNRKPIRINVEVLKITLLLELQLTGVGMVLHSLSRMTSCWKRFKWIQETSNSIHKISKIQLYITNHVKQWKTLLKMITDTNNEMKEMLRLTGILNRHCTCISINNYKFCWNKYKK